MNARSRGALPAITSAPEQLACGHRMCRPGSPECIRRTEVAAELARGSERAALAKLAEALGGRPMYVEKTPHERGCTVAEPCTECRPRPATSAAQSATRHHPLPAALVALIIADARHQLDNVNGTAALLHWGRPELTAQAVANWHHNNPGLSRLLELTRPETTEGS
jgi:hypothetical protein